MTYRCDHLLTIHTQDQEVRSKLASFLDDNYNRDHHEELDSQVSPITLTLDEVSLDFGHADEIAAYLEELQDVEPFAFKFVQSSHNAAGIGVLHTPEHGTFSGAYDTAFEGGFLIPLWDLDKILAMNDPTEAMNALQKLAGSRVRQDYERLTGSAHKHAEL